MTPIRDLDVDKMMAEKIDLMKMNHGESIEKARGVNECVSQNDKLCLVIDEEELAKKLFYGEFPSKLASWNDLPDYVHKIWIDKAKHLKSTVKNWAKIGVEK